MKKLILFISFILFSITTFAQDSTKVDTSSITWTKVYNDTKAGIIGLSSALKIGASHVYVVMVKQQIVTSITNSIVLFLLLFSLICVSFTFYKNYKNTLNENHSWYRDNLEDHFGLLGLLIISVVLGVITLVAILSTLSETIMGLVNPEYGAMKDIISFVK